MTHEIERNQSATWFTEVRLNSQSALMLMLRLMLMLMLMLNAITDERIVRELEICRKQLQDSQQELDYYRKHTLAVEYVILSIHTTHTHTHITTTHTFSLRVAIVLSTSVRFRPIVRSKLQVQVDRLIVVGVDEHKHEMIEILNSPPPPCVFE